MTRKEYLKKKKRPLTKKEQKFIIKNKKMYTEAMMQFVEHDIVPCQVAAVKAHCTMGNY